MTRTDSSRVISCAAASRTASTNDRVRSMAGGGVRFALARSRGEGIRALLVYVGHQFTGIRERAALGEYEGLRDLGLNFLLDAGALSSRQFGCDLVNGV